VRYKHLMYIATIMYGREPKTSPKKGKKNKIKEIRSKDSKNQDNNGKSNQLIHGFWKKLIVHDTKLIKNITTYFDKLLVFDPTDTIAIAYKIRKNIMYCRIIFTYRCPYSCYAMCDLYKRLLKINPTDDLNVPRTYAEEWILMEDKNYRNICDQVEKYVMINKGTNGNNLLDYIAEYFHQPGLANLIYRYVV
jgi:hypothetical protein